MLAICRPVLRTAALTKALNVAVSSRSFSAASEHPWLAKVPAPASFTAEERVLTFLAGMIFISRYVDLTFSSLLCFQPMLVLVISRASSKIGSIFRMPNMERDWK